MTWLGQATKCASSSPTSPALAPITCWCDPDIDDPCFAGLQQRHAIDLERQCGGDLGARMGFAAERTLRHLRGVILIGGDCPVLEAQHLRSACTALADGDDAVLVPAEDGGYVLLGLRRYHPMLFGGIGWGGGEVLSQTRDRLRQLGWRWRELETLWDLDRPEDLQRYRVLTGR